MRKRLTRALLFVVGAFITLIVSGGTAHADMCGPSNLPGASYMWPRVKSCVIAVPGAGSLAPRVPIVVDDQAPSPNYVPPWGSWIQGAVPGLGGPLPPHLPR